MTMLNPTFQTMNDGADFWYYKVGVNVIPVYSKNKNNGDKFSPLQNYREWLTKELDEKTYSEWKQKGYFDQGVAIAGGKVYRGLHSGQYLAMIDLDNQMAIDEFCSHGIERAGEMTLIEQHKDALDRAHIYFYTTKPIKKRVLTTKQKNETDKPKIEVKGDGSHGIHIVTPSIHKDGQPYEIISSVSTPYATSEDLEARIQNICSRHGMPYLDNGESTLTPVKDMLAPEFKVYAGENRHLEVMRYMESKKINNPEFTQDMILQLAKQFNQTHCVPPLADNDPVWIRELNSAMKFSEKRIQEKQNNLNGDRIYKNEDFALVAAEIKARHDFITIKENDQVFMFNGQIYKPFGEQTIREECHTMIMNCKKQTTNEVIDWIRRDKTYRPMQDVYNNYIINTQSGIIDPDTLTILPHGPQYYTLAMLPFKVDPNARNLKLWNHILTIIDPKDITLILELLWMLIGWRNPYKKMFVFKGPSNTQKTTLANIIELIVGPENFSHEKPEKYLGKESRFVTSKFIGKRGNFGSELGNLTQEHIENQKSLVGAEKQNTEKKHDNAEYLFDSEHFVFINTTNNLNAIYKSMNDTSVITRFQFLMFRNVLEDSAQDGDWLAKFFDDDTDKETAISTIVNIMLNYKRAQKLKRIPKTRFSTVEETKKILHDMKDPEEKYFDDNRLVKKHGEKIELEQVKADFERFVGYKVKNNQTMGYILQKNGYKTKQSNSKTWVLDTIFKDPKQGVLNLAE